MESRKCVQACNGRCARNFLHRGEDSHFCLIAGTKGFSDCAGKIWSYEKNAEGKHKVLWEYKGPYPNPYVEEHAHLIAGIRSGKPLNEGKRIAESTLTAIMGRMSAYTGRAMKWDWVMKSSKLDLVPKDWI